MSQSSHSAYTAEASIYFPDHTPDERMAFVREAREMLRTGMGDDGRPLSEDGRALVGAYLADELRALRPRLVVAS